MPRPGAEMSIALAPISSSSAVGSCRVPVHIHAHIYVFVYVCTCMCVRVYVCMRTCIRSVYRCM